MNCQQYGKLLNYFIYDSKNLSKLDEYSESTQISMMKQLRRRRVRASGNCFQKGNTSNAWL